MQGIRSTITRVRPAGTDGALAVCGALLVALSIPVLALKSDGATGAVTGNVVAALAAGVCVAQSRRRPVAAILGFSLALIAAVAMGNSDLDQDNPLLLIPYFLLPVTWAANTDRRTFVRSAPLVVVLFPLAIVLNNPESAVSSLIFVLLIPLGLGGAGGRLMAWHAAAAERLRLQAQEIDANREARAAAAVTAERARIARDLHDLIAHDVSVMVVQAQAAERLALRDPGAAEQAITQIETTGREALTETRRLLGVLRQGDEELALRPQPSMRRIATLMDELRERGVDTELEVEGTTATLSPGLDMAAYRILSDGLRSVVAHGGARHARALVRSTPSDLELRLEADGSLSPATYAGLRERTLLFGGTLDVVQQAAGGGGVIHVHLPVGEERSR